MVAGAIYKSPEHAPVYISPLIDWTKADVLDAIAAASIPESEVVATIHKSGECLCGAFAAEGELEELSVFWPKAAQRLYDLQRRVWRLRGGSVNYLWGKRPRRIPPGQGQLWSEVDEPPPGPLCADCGLR